MAGPEQITTYVCGKCEFKQLTENKVPVCVCPDVLKAVYGVGWEDYGRKLLTSEPLPQCLIVRGLA